MPLDQAGVSAAVKEMLRYRKAETPRLERIALYSRDPEPQAKGFVQWGALRVGPLAWLPKDAPEEIKRIARMSRVNMLKFVVDATVQVMYVDGYRHPTAEDDPEAWGVWQQNRMDARQIGVHRSSLTYGASYVYVLPGEPVDAIGWRGPRRMTVVYEADGDDWPRWALEKRRGVRKGVSLWRLFDDQAAYWVELDDKENVRLVQVQEHGKTVTPVVRFRPTIDDDDDGEGAAQGDVEPYIPLQDQINITTFGLLVAQHYGAFRQRYILGWMADSEEQAVTASARKLWTFEGGKDEVQVGEFGQTDLKGYIDSREATLRHLATVSQTPAHELLGQLANLSAEALAAAEANHRRKVLERQTVMGEAWEQVLELTGKGDPMAYVRWKDTEARSLATVADALGKLATMLGVPPKELWERIPGVSQQEVDRWKKAAEDDPIAQLNAMLRRDADVPA